MHNLDISPDKSLQQEEDVIAIVSMTIFNRNEYEGLKVNKISPCKVIDDWGVVIKEVHPMIFVGKKEDIEHKTNLHVQEKWSKYNSTKDKKWTT